MLQATDQFEFECCVSHVVSCLSAQEALSEISVQDDFKKMCLRKKGDRGATRTLDINNQPKLKNTTQSENTVTTEMKHTSES